MSERSLILTRTSRRVHSLVRANSPTLDDTTVLLPTHTYTVTPIVQNHILINSSLTALGNSTPDSVIIPEIKCGGV